ncbi:MAG: hypothetical protein AABX48_00180 [Nanoarchaeota archaeon]
MKKLILPISLIVLVGFTALVSAILTKNNFQQVNFNDNFGGVSGDHVTIHLKQGWNLLPLAFIADAGGRYWGNYKEGSTCSQDVFQNVWFYSPEFGDYYHIPVDKGEQLANIDDWRYPKTRGNDFLLNEFKNKYYHIYAGSAWVYSEKGCTLEGDEGIKLTSSQVGDEEQERSYKYDELVLRKGWNFIPVDMLMVASEASFSQIFEGCNVIKYNAWNNEKQDWVVLKEDMQSLDRFNSETPDKENIFSTLVIKTDSDCNLAKNIYGLLGAN